MPTHSVTGDRPVYEQIADDLRAAIGAGTLGPGSRLPSESNLANTYGVQRLTVRKGIRVLVGEGLVTSLPKKGTFVRRVEEMAWNLRARDPWQDAVDHGCPGEQQISVQTVPAETRLLGIALVDLLDIGQDDFAVCRSRVRRVRGDKVELADTYYPYGLVKETSVMRPHDIPSGVSEIFERLGYQALGTSSDICSRQPSRDEADRLGLPPSTPVMELMRRHHFGPGERCLIVHHSIFAGGPGRKFII